MTAMRQNPAVMHDVTIQLENRPGALADIGEALGSSGINIEGGGAWLTHPTDSSSYAVAHFLFEDGHTASRILVERGMKVLAVRGVIVQRLRQGEPGQLGKLTRRMAEAGVNIEVLYSDHANRLILVVDDPAKAREVADAWAHGTALYRLPAIHIEV